MGKKIVVITGSPRKNGNSFAMTDAFIRAAEKKGHCVVRFDAAMMNINGCRACRMCFKTEKACSVDDEYNKIAKEIMESDAVVFTMPVYFYTIPAQLKGIFDKFYSFLRLPSGCSVAGKECALIACCQEKILAGFEGVLIPYRRTAALLGWKSKGEVLVPGVLNPGEVEKTDGIKRAEELAGEF